MTTVAPEPAVECVKVERTYGSGETLVSVLRGLDLTINRGTLVALYGPSGSGKTTLLNLIGTLDAPTSGVIRVLGQDIVRFTDTERAKLRREKIGFVFQSYALLNTHTALENVELTLRLPHLPFRTRQERAKEALASVGLSSWANHLPDELSGGQRQRVAIARAIALRPQLMLADEPTSGLDTRTTKQVLLLFREIAEVEGTTFVIVSHDPLVAEHVDLAYDLQDGQLVEHQPESVVSSSPSFTPTFFNAEGSANR